MKYFLKMQLALHFKKYKCVYTIRRNEKEETLFTVLREATKQEKIRREFTLLMTELICRLLTLTQIKGVKVQYKPMCMIKHFPFSTFTELKRYTYY